MFDPGGESPQYNQGPQPSQAAHAIRWGFLFGSTLNIALVLYSMFRFPTSWSLSWKGMEGVLATTGIVMVYALLGWFVTPRIARRNARILRYASLFGLVIGLFFAIMMLIEYLVPHTTRQNVILAFAIFGTFFLLLSVAGFVGALRHSQRVVRRPDSRLERPDRLSDLVRPPVGDVLRVSRHRLRGSLPRDRPGHRRFRAERDEGPPRVHPPGLSGRRVFPSLARPDAGSCIGRRSGAHRPDTHAARLDPKASWRAC